MLSHLLKLSFSSVESGVGGVISFTELLSTTHGLIASSSRMKQIGRMSLFSVILFLLITIISDIPASFAGVVLFGLSHPDSAQVNQLDWEVSFPSTLF